MPSREPVRAGRPPARGVRKEQVVDLLCQALEAELGCAKVYEAAVRSAQHEGLRGLWNGSLERSRHRAQVLRTAFGQLGVKPDAETAGRDLVRRTQAFLAESIDDGRTDAPAASAQLIAADCVVLAETRVDSLWLLVRGVADVLAGERGRALKAACALAGTVPSSAPWAHELWLQAIGLPATPSSGPPQAPPATSAAPAKGSGPTHMSAWGTQPR